MPDHYLEKLFEPNAVAVFGASPKTASVGAVVLQNLLQSGFGGKIYPINPAHDAIGDLECYPDLDALNQAVNLAVIATPAHTVPAIIESCGQHNIKAAIILSAGFREAGEAGRALEQQVLENARRHELRFLGPNCLGLIRPGHGVNATFNRGRVKMGKLALVSQSGALCTAILDWADTADIGFSAVISTGISADIGVGEILDYLLADSDTQAVLIYLEGVEDARSFMSGLRAIARIKPVVVVKAGRHKSGEQAVRSHTGMLVGADDIFDSALRRAGVVRGMHVGDLFAAATVLAEGLRVKGENLAIITNGGGPAAMACDRASDLAIPLATLGQATLDRLNKELPAMWSHGNPVDVLGDADAGRYELAVSACLADDKVHGALVMLTPQAMTSPSAVADSLIALARNQDKPVISCWMGDAQVREAREKFVAADIPTFRLPETAVRGFSYLTDFHRNQKLLLQTPGPLSERDTPDVEGARLIIESVLAHGRETLTETESKAVLSCFRIHVAATTVARDAGEALAYAETFGFPVAMKIHSKDISHKSDVNGVRLGLSNAGAVRQAFFDLQDSARQLRPEAAIDGVAVEPMVMSAHGRELMIGIVRDPVFGPVISVGMGGTEVEVIGDRAVALPPLNGLLIRDLIERTRLARLLQQFRHMPPVDFKAVERVLLRVSEMACELPWIRELDINPLIADEHGATAVDARICVAHYNDKAHRYSHMAIHPYPMHLVTRHILHDGTELTIRPIRPEDAEMEQKFVHDLSDRARYLRFFRSLRDLPPEMLVRFTQIDYDREMALIAVIEKGGEEIEIGVCRYNRNPDGKSCEFAIVVADQWQHKGIAHKLMEQLVEYARFKGLKTMEGDVLTGNTEMQALARSLGFRLVRHLEDSTYVSIVKQL